MDLPLPTSPMAAVLLRWAHGAEPELRVGDLSRLHEDLEALLRQVGVPPEHVQRACSTSLASWNDGAVGGACDTDEKSDAAQWLEPGAASQERGQ